MSTCMKPDGFADETVLLPPQFGLASVISTFSVDFSLKDAPEFI